MQQHVLTSSMSEVTRSHHGKNLESNACLGSLSHSIPYHPRPTRRLFVTEPYSCGIELRGPRVIWCARSRTTRDRRCYRRDSFADNEFLRDEFVGIDGR